MNEKLLKIAKKIMADEKVIVDTEYNKTYSIKQLEKIYQEAKNNGETEAVTFEDYLDNITDKNGTCEWISDNICKKCFNKIDDVLLTVDGEENICWDCAEKMAQEAKKENKDIKIEMMDSPYDECHLCTWCQTLYPEDELREEQNVGYLCDWCIQGILSHGEHLNLIY